MKRDDKLDRPVDHTENGSIAVITLNRPERLNTLTESMIAGVADGIDAATAPRQVRSVIIRGAGRFDDVASVDALVGRFWSGPLPR